MGDRKEKIGNQIREIVGGYISENSNRNSLITVTRCDISPNLKTGIVFISVMPQDKENAALYFIQRNLKDMRSYIRTKMATKIIPFLEVQLDSGEKNRQRMDELSREAGISPAAQLAAEEDELEEDE